MSREIWPALPLQEWKPTLDTLHMWTQIVGKLRLKLAPAVNHWWHVPLYVCPQGLTTGAMPYKDRTLQATFDFREHALLLQCNDSLPKFIGFYPRSVADFYGEFSEILRALEVEVKIWTMPVEVPNPIRFEEDNVHASYDREAVERFSRILQTIDPVFQEFRGRFLGKSSPVHFFWGSFDLAVTRFNGHRAPEREGADPITREAYSHEVISVGWWPGGDSPWGPSIEYPAFYAYAAPEPERISEVRIRPTQAFYHNELHEFLLRYDDVRTSSDPKRVLLDFCQSSYDAAADLGHWERSELERPLAEARKTA